MRWNTKWESLTGRVRLGDDYISLCPSDMRCLGFDDNDLRWDIPFELTVERDPEGNMWMLPMRNGSYKLAKSRDAVLMNDYIMLNVTDLAPLGLSSWDVGERIRVRAIRTGRVTRICCHDVIWWFEGIDVEELDDASEAAIMESIVDNRPEGKLEYKGHDGYWYIKGC